ncbi:MAG: hypothetical protein IKW62_02865 [Clostridia bacterium]|nr:hypothetical protein [Clostridia bacterium]
MTDKLDFYSGYEGEPEIIFELIKNNNSIKTVHIWDGHLLFIVEKAVKTDIGWKGIAGAYYNGDMDDVWEFDNLRECLDDLERTDISTEDNETQMVYYALIDLFKEAIEKECIIKVYND